MESEVHQVLSVCLHADVDVVKRDLLLTRNVDETVNRILDGLIKPITESRNIDVIAGSPSGQHQGTLNHGVYPARASDDDGDDDDDDHSLPSISLGPGKTATSSVHSDKLEEVKVKSLDTREEAIVDLTLEEDGLTLEEDGRVRKTEHYHNILLKPLHHEHRDKFGSGSSVSKDEKACNEKEISCYQGERPVTAVSLPAKAYKTNNKNSLHLDAANTELHDLTSNDLSPPKKLRLGPFVDISSSDNSEEEGGRVTHKQLFVSDLEEKHGTINPPISITSNFGVDANKEPKSHFVKKGNQNTNQTVGNLHSCKQSRRGNMIDVSSSDDSDDELPLWKRIQRKNEDTVSSFKFSGFDNGVLKGMKRNEGGNTVERLVSDSCKSVTLERDSQFSTSSTVSVSHHVTSSSNGLSDDFSQSVNSSESQFSDVSKGLKRKKKSPEEIELSKQQALERRIEREKQKQEREQKKEEKRKEKERELEQRKALREAHKALRPEECMKRMTTTVDQSLIQGSCGPTILKKLQDFACKVVIIPQQVEGAITWCRQQTELNLGQDIQLSNLCKETEETDALLVMKMSEFVHLIHATTQNLLGNITDKETLNNHAHRCIQTLGGKSLTYLVQGAEQYFRNSKNRRQRNFRSAVLGAEPDQTKNKKGKRTKDNDGLPDISRVQMEEALVSLQLQHGCNVHCSETPDAVADFIGMFTKAVAEKPFKRERDKSTFSFHVNSEWAGGVKVSKDGVGMIKVWKQQLQQFRNVSPEIAAAIIAKYSSPQLLLQGYRNCDSTREAEMLLQDIVIRRGEGVLATTRRIGPELSRRVYKQMTSVDGDQLL